MISICIPIFNFNVSSLVETLENQLHELDQPSEIILIDDCSNLFFRNLNEGVCSKYQYIKLDKNIGRAAIRNLFLKYANYDNLLFLDCDSIVFKDDFLINYIEAIDKFPHQVFCGGRIYSNKAPKRDERLRWKYGKKRESKSSDVRNENPNRSFMTHNFLINKKIFETVKFDERLTEYGHEDTLFGFELKKKCVMVKHIDNPILNGDLEKNSNYLLSNEKAMENLVKILVFTNYNKDFINDVSVLRMYFKYEKYRTVIRFVFKIFKPLIKKILSAGFVNLYLFDFYKLGTLAYKMQTVKNSYNQN